MPWDVDHARHLADANVDGHVEWIVKRIVAGTWLEFWNHIGIVLATFSELGLVDLIEIDLYRGTGRLYLP